MKRRDFLKSGFAAVLLAGLDHSSQGGFGVAPVHAASPGISFRTPLPVPPLLEPFSREESHTTYGLIAQTGQHQFFPDVQTATLGYNGSFLGPTIRVKNGEHVKFNVYNMLDQVTTVHWHGLHVPAKWDGGPRQEINPGSFWNPEFTIRQEAATLWYHPHAMGLTGEHVYRGLAGLLLIEDDGAAHLGLPTDYGVDDLPIIIQDRRFFSDGRLAYVQSMHDVMHGVIGNYLIINGTLEPFVEVPRGVVRLRLLNGSNSSIYRLHLSGEKQMQVVATDGGFIHRPVALTELILSAGERAEIVVDFSGDQSGQQTELFVDQYGGRRYEAMQFRVGKAAGRITTLPGILRAQKAIAETEATHSRIFAMETFSRQGRGRGMMGGNRLTINGRKMNLNRIDEKVQLGTTEIWEVVNTSASMMQLPHSMHIHDIQFYILDRNGHPPAPYESGRKDTVLVMPGERVRLIMHFNDYTGIYMYHCHMLEHEDDGMMGQFEVVAT